MCHGNASFVLEHTLSFSVYKHVDFTEKRRWCLLKGHAYLNKYAAFTFQLQHLGAKIKLH